MLPALISYIFTRLTIGLRRVVCYKVATSGQLKHFNTVACVNQVLEFKLQVTLPLIRYSSP